MLQEYVTIDLMKKAFGEEQQAAVVCILGEITEALGRAYNLGIPLLVTITNKNPVIHNDTFTGRPVSIHNLKHINQQKSLISEIFPLD